jgi:HK97 gp10 family phage protein
MPNSKVTIKGDKELLAKFKALGKAAQGETLVHAATAGILPIQNEAISTVVKDTGNLARSIHTETLESSNTYAEVATGTDVAYGARIEFGFMQADSLGRHYNQAAQPYLRPAHDNKSGEAIKETQAALLDLINAIAGS